ncbi:cell division ATP-binding protein FtsE [Filifactor villosus]|uniref:Cell division ATP-binding protein FtsE n=1 Tax=Filifactor villosus TaxID=29374 RepID=A0ABV9QL12_9FIRM
MIIFENVSKSYFKNAPPALTDVNFEIEEGEFVFLIGKSGAGKSTIVKLLMKEIDASKGEIIVLDHSLRELSLREIPMYRRHIGIVFQEFRLFQNKTVYENLEFALEITGTPYQKRRERILYALSSVNLRGKEKFYPHQLSGGEQQRVAIARALINKPSIIIADEPTGNLDPESAREVMQLLFDLSLKKITVIVATHAQKIVDEMDQRTIEFKNGRVVRDEPGRRGILW